MNHIAFFEIQSSNIQREIAFYSKVFGWKFEKDPTGPFEIHRIKTNGILGALIERPAKVPPQEHGTNAFTCSIQVADFDAVASLIMDAGGIVALPKFAIPGRCWQGYFMDRDHNVFGIFEVDENAQ